MYKNYDELGAQPDMNKDILDVVEVQNSQHKNHIIRTNRIVCLEIYADWCGPCKQTASSYSIVASNYSKPNFCAVVKYNFEKMEPAEKTNIHGIPVFEFFVNGNKIGEIVGANIEEVETKLKGLVQQENNQFSNTQSEDVYRGPAHTRNSIRNSRSQIPQMDSSSGSPYQPNPGNYHQPYQTNSRQQPQNFGQQYQNFGRQPPQQQRYQ